MSKYSYKQVTVCMCFLCAHVTVVQKTLELWNALTQKI